MAEAGPALSALGEMVRAGDRDRFESALFADPAPRERMFAVYGLNLEAARAPWRVSETQIGVMRLRWWLDVIDEAEAGAPPRAHEVAEPLAAFIQLARPPSQLLQDLVTARLRDLEPEPMASEEDLERYIADTGGALMRLAGWAALGGAPAPEMEAALGEIGWAHGAANLIEATPHLAARGRVLLPNPPGAPIPYAAICRGETPEPLREALRRLAHKAETRLAAARRVRLDAALVPAALAAWRAPRILRAARKTKLDMLLHLGPESEFRRRASLLWRGGRGKW